MKSKLLVSCLFVFLLSSPLAALATTFKVDPVHSNIGFKVSHLVVSKVRGSFNSYTGQVEFNSKTKKLESVSAVIKASSIDTKNQKRDGHLRSPDFFGAKRDPNITFKSTKVIQNGDDITIVGNLKMKGVTKKITLKGNFNGMITAQKGKLHLGFEGKGKISRKDFGMTWNKILEAGGLAVGDEVTIVLEIEAIEQ
ncbi:MAG: YceI family protein [SAR324 cluster bacterium]|nr:YceI family protein [SAR324 cluster bacterium]